MEDGGMDLAAAYEMDTVDVGGLSPWQSAVWLAPGWQQIKHRWAPDEVGVFQPGMVAVVPEKVAVNVKYHPPNDDVPELDAVEPENIAMRLKYHPPVDDVPEFDAVEPENVVMDIGLKYHPPVDDDSWPRLDAP